jgi:DNA-binding NtrC family response regulator
LIQGPAKAAPATTDRVVLVCRNAGRRPMLERLVGAAEVHATALEAVLAVTRRGARAVVLNLEDVAGAERDLLAAIRRGRPETRVYAVVGPEDEPLARSLVGEGMADYFVTPGDVNRLPQALAPAPAEQAV